MSDICGKSGEGNVVPGQQCGRKKNHPGQCEPPSPGDAAPPPDTDEPHVYGTDSTGDPSANNTVCRGPNPPMKEWPGTDEPRKEEEA